MALKHYTAQNSFGAVLLADSCDPIDARILVDNKSDITTPSTFGTISGGKYCKVYLGIDVYCADTRETYKYVGPADGNGVLSTDVEKIENWRKVSSPDSSIDELEQAFNKIANAAGISGASAGQYAYNGDNWATYKTEHPNALPTYPSKEELDAAIASGNITADDYSEAPYNFAYSSHTMPEFVASQAPTSIQSEVVAIEKALTPTTSTDAKVTTVDDGVLSHKNIISITKDGVEAFADLHYDAATNKLTFINTNAKKEIALTGVNLIKRATYNAALEQIEIYYTAAGSTGETMVAIPVKDIIEEYDFQSAASGGTIYNTDATLNDHNVSLIRDTRVIDGHTKIYGDINIFDCGTY